MVLTKVVVSSGIVMSVRMPVRPISCYGPVRWMGMSHRIVTLSMPNSLQIFQCLCAAALLWQWMYSVLASSGQPETR